ncbi:uncharacterized protein LOC115078211 [Rhinatrema bivittatum]|uniref:uncharacterized protein LOC115078211 n=1 Tax=Rhinatrema bivittatum TaxID=194408 RepID=UPI0011288D1D|nr:uncharacterized protein LOC115078211 [Rhinatrema bivittatum]
MSFLRSSCLFSKVVGVQLFLYQTQRFLFSEVSGTASISCFSHENLESGSSIIWFRRRADEAPVSIKSCADDQNISKFACNSKTHSTTLTIQNAQRNESGVYYCVDTHASRFPIFVNGTTLIVGDSYTARSSVILTSPHREALSRGSAHLACIIQAVSGLVAVSWNVSGTLEHRKTSSEKENDGSLTLTTHVSIPRDHWHQGQAVTCQVRFNSSHSGIQRQARYWNARGVSADFAGECWSYLVPVVAVSVLLLLVLSLSVCQLHLRSDPGAGGKRSQTPSSGEVQDGIVYMQLDFAATPKPKGRTRGQGQRRSRTATKGGEE